MEKFEHLQIVLRNLQDDERTIMQKIKNPDERYHYISFLEGFNIVHAISCIYIDNDKHTAKEHFYKAAASMLYMSKAYDWRVMDTGINQISSALLSDDKEMIEDYMALRNTTNNESTIGFQLPNAIQNTLANNYDELEANIRNLERFVLLTKFKAYEGTVGVFKGIMSNNTDQIIIGLNQLLKTHKKRNTDPLISKFLSIDTAGLCKLAWLKGLQINLENDLVPQTLMPVEPLQSYKTYDFLS